MEETRQEKIITLLLVEDHHLVRKGLRLLIELEKDMTVSGEAKNGLEAIKLAKRLKPSVILVDIALPKLNGIEAIRRILEIKPKLPSKIIVLSAYSDDGYIEKVNALGVSGFLVKHCAPTTLIRAVRTTVAGGKFFSPIIQSRINLFNNDSLNPHRESNKKTNLLTRREIEVVQLIAEGLANKQISYDLNISIKTVEKHRQNLMKKLLIHDTAGLTRYAITEGLIDCRYKPL